MKSTRKAKICSQCGLCMVDTWPSKEGIASCVFTSGWLGMKEQSLFGRVRFHDQDDEMRFGISRERFIARLKKPVPRTQFTGIITRIAQKAFESGMVEAVVTLHRSSDDFFFPQPVLARTTEEILAGGGSKSVLAQSLVSLAQAYRDGIRKLLVIGTPCQIHNLRTFQALSPYLAQMDIFVIGIPCTDNVLPQKFRWMLNKITRSHETACHIEYMQDFCVHIRHTNGKLERVPFFSFPQELSGTNIFPASCMCCFDYLNSLADITVGYLGAPLDVRKKYQWVIVRTERGESLKNLIVSEMEVLPEYSAGETEQGIQMYASQLFEKIKKGPDAPLKKGRAMSLKDGKALAKYVCEVGPRGLAFARYAIDMHLVRNYYFVQERFPTLFSTLVPEHVPVIIKRYGLPLIVEEIQRTE